MLPGDSWQDNCQIFAALESIYRSVCITDRFSTKLSNHLFLCEVDAHEGPHCLLRCRVECQKLGEDLQQAYRAANQALEEIPAFEDIPRVDRRVVKELAEGTGEQAISAFRNSRGAAGTTAASDATDPKEGNGHNSSNGVGTRRKTSEATTSGTRQGREDNTASSLEEGINVAAGRAQSAVQQVATAAREQVGPALRETSLPLLQACKGFAQPKAHSTLAAVLPAPSF